jgi:RNA polymerase sigma-70 factor (family 1)
MKDNFANYILALIPLHNEKTLLKQMAEGDEISFGHIYKAYHNFLYRFILKFVKSPDLAEDLTQEIFIRIWELRKEMKKVDSFQAYLFITARNHTLNFLKKVSKENIAKAEIMRHYKPVQRMADDELLSAEYRQFIQNVLDSLPAQTREVFRLSREQYKSYDEVAALLGISRHAVKKHMVRSHKKFKDLLGDETDISLSLALLLFSKF